MQQILLGALAGLVAVLTAFLGFSDKTVNQVVDSIAHRATQALGGVTNFDILDGNSLITGVNATSTPALYDQVEWGQSIEIPVGQAHGYYCNTQNNSVVASEFRVWKTRAASTTNTEYLVTAGTSTTIVSPTATAFYSPTDRHDVMFHQVFAETSTTTSQADYNSKLLPVGANQVSSTSPQSAILRPSSCVQFRVNAAFPKNRHCVNTAETCETATSSAGYTGPVLFFKITATTTPRSVE